MGRQPDGRLDDMVVFARVVEAGSLAAAARALRTTRSAVSKSVGRLERHLGTRLLQRTTRQLSATAAGQVCYAHCARIAAEADSARQAARALRAKPQGPLRVDCALALSPLVSPVLPRFAAAHPGVSLELSLTDRMVDLVREGVDVAIRLGRLPDSTLMVRKVAPYHVVVFASPAYLARHKAPRTPADLAGHACLLRSGHDQWRFTSDAGESTVAVSGRFRADTPEPVRQAALAGLGIAYLPSFVVAQDLARGALVPLLERFTPREAAICAVYPQQRYLSPNVRAFVDFLVEAWPR